MLQKTGLARAARLASPHLSKRCEGHAGVALAAAPSARCLPAAASDGTVRTTAACAWLIRRRLGPCAPTAGRQPQRPWPSRALLLATVPLDRIGTLHVVVVDVPQPCRHGGSSHVSAVAPAVDTCPAVTGVCAMGRHSWLICTKG